MEKSSRLHGLELQPSIEFDNYEGGVKMTKRLSIKNTTKKLIRFRFLFQSSVYFTYPLQEVESISAGLNKSYPITFFNPLNDFQTVSETLNIVIEDKQRDKRIEVHLRATPLKCDVILPSVLHFKDMVIKQKGKEELVIKNQGALNAVIKLTHKFTSKEKKGKIKVEPSQFVLKSSQKQNVQIILYSDSPQKFQECLSCSIIEVPKDLEAKIFPQGPKVTNATLNNACEDSGEKGVNDIIQMINQENVQARLIKKRIQLNWVAVLPQIIILSDQDKQIFHQSVVNFGEVALGQRLTRSIYLHNVTSAPITVKVKKRNKKKENAKKSNVFHLLKEQFTIKEGSKEEIIFHINGQNQVNQYTEMIQFKACTDYCIEVFFICEIKNVKLHFTKVVYLLENLKLGDSVTEKLTIRNDDDTDVYVEIVNLGYIFSAKSTSFVVKKNSYHFVNLTYHCIYPINVYKRLYFLVHLNKEIFYVDIICNYSVSYKMCPLSMHHVFRSKHFIHDKQTLYNSYYDKKDYIDIWDFPLEFDSYEDSTYEMINEIVLADDGDLFVVPQQLEILESEEKDVMIINKTPLEYTCVWSNAVDQGRGKCSIFQIYPAEAQLLPFGCQTFRVKNAKTLKEKYTREVYECIVFPSNNRDYRKCNSKTLLLPRFLYVTLFQFKIKYLCETENILDSLYVYPKQISFLNIIEEENTYAVMRFANNSDAPQMIDFTPFKGDVESIRVAPLVNYVPSRGFLNVLISYSPKKAQLTEGEIKLHYLVNGIEKKHISVFVSHEINSVLFNGGDLNINLPCVSTDTESSKKVAIENMTERNVLCMLVKEDATSILGIHMKGNNPPLEVQSGEEHIPHKNDQVEELNKWQIQNGNQKKNEGISSLTNEDKKYTFYFFCLLPFEKRNIYICACSDSTLTKSVPLLLSYMLYTNQEDMKSKFTFIKKNMKDHIKRCKRFLVHVNIIKCALTLHPKVLESEPIIVGSKFNAKIKIHNENPVKVNFKTKTEIVQIDNRRIFDEEEIKEADRNVVVEKKEDVINSFSGKYAYVSFKTNQQGRFVYRFCVIVGGYKNYVDIVLKVVMPYFQIIDINDFKTPQSIYWNMTSADRINSYLKEDISTLDTEYKKSQGMENMKKLFNQFDYIPFNIGNNTLNEVTRVNMVLFNPLNVPLKIHINSIKSYVLPVLPPYVKNEEEQLAHLLYVDNAYRNFMRCLDCCKITPTNFEIKEKGTKTITLFYKHKYIGLHNMPLIIDVENGKVLALNLTSLTFSPRVPPIYLMNVKDLNEHVLGLKNECIINIDLLNDSELDIHYAVERCSHLVVLNPKGVIKRRKYISLFVLVSRLSPTIINETLILKPHFRHLNRDIELDKVTIELTLNSTSDNVYKDAHKTINVFNNKCIGDFPGQGIKTFCSNFVPAYSYIYAQNKLFYVSPSSINILYAPTNSIVERIVIIKNYSSSRNLKFKIPSKNTLPGNVLKITPNKGVVKREGHIILRLTFILSDILLDIEGNIQIEFKYVEDQLISQGKNEEDRCNIGDVSEEKIEEVYEDTRDKQGRTKEPKTLQISKAKKATKFDDLTFSHAQKIFENIQMFKYAYDNVNTNMLQKAVRRLYGVKNGEPSKEENPKESIKQGIKDFPKFYFYIHVKLFTCNSDDVATAKNNFENLVRTNIYPQHLYFKRYISLPIPLEDKSKSFFKRHYFDFDKLEKPMGKESNQDGKGNRTLSPEEIACYKRDIYACMFTEMFKSIIEKDIKNHIAILSDINACSIQTIESILREDIIDAMSKTKRTDCNFQMKSDYTFLKPTILSHFFSHMFSDIIGSLLGDASLFSKNVD
ncbi:conserved Plasmodium protein, unknown function [Plasmodium knowlesi strain H]|uniref:CFAP65-like ninth Ig-like domain-containing protein n=2 Tax=Plasmodium knowlesi TaxID=5850 RepID=A0A679L502_PLAKH|nr:conserved Plasmodium protein, unknown function [Plasmodium knowlesi strain H]OTN65131.1 Uncharacterized protein PKNOH_S120139400 [Plasmodium knowlesi]CAA9988251.1 conserved Plasmodium protein, unknown function [Plasmodium knowlesi strain H]VVS77725.1 conserved Plasmodium protein, unknown function [Plasmodium knowlesi strain H]